MRPRAVRQVTLLPEPDSPDDAERLAAMDLEGEPVDGLDEPVGGREMDLQVADLEQGFGHMPRSVKRKSRVPHPRVEIGVGDVDDEVHERDQKAARTDPDTPAGRRRPRGLDHLGAEARDVEDRLGDDGAAEQEREIHAEHA